MQDFSKSRAAFRKLHEDGCFVIPNPWDIGSAKCLQALGFSAVATTSAGFALSRGRSDDASAEWRDEVIRHCAELASAVDIPVNADFQAGYADDPAGLQESVRRLIGTGVAGFSIEDATGDGARPLYELSEAVDRLTAARQAIDSSGADVLLTARSECFLVGHENPLPESIRRLRAYAEAGADVLFAPCPATRENVRAIVEAARPKPVNAIVFGSFDLTVYDLAELGVRRISVGSGLARTAWTAFLHAAREIVAEGRFTSLGGSVSTDEIAFLMAR